MGPPATSPRWTTGTLIWNGLTAIGTDPNTGRSILVSVSPPSVTADGAGTGAGTLDLVAQQVLFGYGPNTEPQDQVALNRQTLGFSTVNVEASQSISAQ